MKLPALLLALPLAACASRPFAFAPASIGLVHRAGGEGDIYNDCAFSPNGEHLAAATADGPIHVFDPKTGEGLFEIEGHEGGTGSIAYSADGKYFASGGADGSIRIWEGKEARVVKAHQGMIWTLRFSPDDRVLASAGVDGTTKIWDVKTGKPLAVIEGTQPDHNAIVFSTDGAVLATCGQNSSMLLFDVRANKPLAALNDGRAIVSAASPVSDLLYTGSMDGMVEAWSLSKRKKVAQYHGSGSRFSVPMTLTPDGAWLLIGDGPTLRIYEAANGKLVSSLKVHATPILTVALSIDGTVATTSGEGPMAIWARGGSIPRKSGWAGVSTDGKGCAILQVVAGGPADRAGLKEKDVIVKVGDAAVKTHEELVRAISARKEGDEVEFTIERQGREERIKVKLGARPDEE